MEMINDFKATYKAIWEKAGLKEKVLDSYKFTPLKKFFGDLNYSGEKITLPVTSNNFITLNYLSGNIEIQGTLPEGVKVGLIKDHFQDVKEFLKDEQTLSSLHHANFGRGLFISIAKNTELSGPIYILNKLEVSELVAPTHLIVAGANSKATIIEETIGAEIAHTLLTETYITAAAGAQIEHIFLDEESKDGQNHGTLHAEVARDATVKSFIFHGAGKLNRKNLTLCLNEPGANGESYSLFLTNQEEHSDLYTLIDHKAADTTSAQMAKGILDGTSRGIFTGKIFIRPDSQRVASSQLNKNLLLSNKAQAHSQPQLEIYADDVKCSHGSTTGQLSDDELFYFCARGIPAEKAKTLLALGFGLEIVQKITNDEARKYLEDKIIKTLETKFDLGGI